MIKSTNPQRLLTFSLLNVFIISVCLLTSLTSSAIIIRHDKHDKDYQVFAAKYQATMAYLDICVGTVIDPTWVITAAHCVSPNLDSPVKITHLNNAYAVEKIVIHPEFGEDHDVALIKLRWPLKKAVPAKLYLASDELNKLVTFVGNGKTGTGLTGDQAFDKTTRAATNTVNTIEPFWLTFNFDNPDTPNSRATQLEGVSGLEDSGGPAFIEHNDVLYIAGVGCCQVPAVNDSGVEIPGSYGSTEYYSRISAHIKWINETLSTSNNQYTHKLPESLLTAINNDDINRVHQLLQQEPSWRQHSALATELLLLAIYKNKLELFETIITSAPELLNTTIQNQPLGAYAYQYGSAQLFQLLVKMGIDLNYLGFQGQDYLSLITWQYHQNDYPTLVEPLLNKGFDINRQDKRGDSALHLAGFYGKADRIKYLLDKGANINLADHKGNTVLMDMARQGNTTLLNLLLMSGADTNIKNKAGKTALDLAQENNQLACSELIKRFIE